MNNLPPFHVGQKVVYITGIRMPKNSIHIVTRVCKYNCGCWAIEIDTGGPPNAYHPTTTHVRCNYCHKAEPIWDFLPMFENCWDAESFRAAQELGFPLIQLTKVIEKEQQLVSAN